MDFQPNLPLISSIRAKFIIEKLGNYPRSLGCINVFVTGRTGSGKTTLGNRLLGVDYFLSTGQQDCTKEVNLIEFPIGLKYFDLPGVCSDDRLENFNRFALGMEQVEDFPLIENLTLAKFREGQAPEDDYYSAEDFKNLQFKPDLIFYLIAPDKQFTRNDRKYLRDLLKHHHQIIYVFNMFVNKDTGKSFAATEANLIDAVKKVVEIHTSVLGKDSKPIIVGANCLTGEGIAKLLVQSQILLGETKGKLLEELIKYQQQKTPDEYLHKVKLELLKLFAFAACQKPNGNNNCDQSLYRCCYILLNFVTNLQETSETTSSSIEETISNLVDEIFSTSYNYFQQPSSHEDENNIDYIVRGITVIEAGVDLINEKINSLLTNPQKEILEYRNQKVAAIRAELEKQWEDIDALENKIESLIENYKIKESELRSFIEEVDDDIDEYNDNLQELNSTRIKLIHRRNRLDSRINSYSSRIDNYNEIIGQFNSGYGRVSEEAIQSIERERDYLSREEVLIKKKENKFQDDFDDFQEFSEFLEKEEKSLTKKIKRRDKKIKKLQVKRSEISNEIKLRNQSQKYVNDKAEFTSSFINYFDQEFDEINNQIKLEISEINDRLKEIRETISKFSFSNNQYINEEENLIFQEQINTCIDKMKTFFEKIFLFHKNIQLCIDKLEINQLVTEVILKCTNYHFNDADNFDYQGSTYTYFQQDALVLLLCLLNLFFVKYEMISKQESLNKNYILSKVNNIGTFPKTPKEANIFQLLERRMDSLFPTVFDEIVRKVAL